MRVELPDGQWAELREELTHGFTKRLQRAIYRVAEDGISYGPELATEFVAVYTSAWSVRGVGEIPPAQTASDLDARLPLIDSLPESVVQAIFDKASELWRGRADPNASAATSPSSPVAEA